MAIPSVHPSVCLSVTRVDQSKTVEARITQFALYSSPMQSTASCLLLAYFAPVGDAKYVDEYVCVSVCLLVRERKKVVV